MAELTNNKNNIEAVHLLQSANLEDSQKLLDDVCHQVAQHFSLCGSDGKPRKAKIVEIIARSSCLTCIAEMLSTQTTGSDVDALYKECHKLAVNILVEELYDLLSQMGYKVLVSTETELEYGKADVLITITNYSINLKCGANELLVEVKTGNSISLSQLFRYLLDGKRETIVIWRVRRRQVLAFKAQEIKFLLMEFMRMICLRGNRLLSSPQLQPCQHRSQPNYQPTAEELEKMLIDYSKAIIETLPYALQTILKELEINH